MTTNIRKISENDHEGLEMVVDLHLELLDFGPFANLGKRFLMDIGYQLHLQDGLMEVDLCEIDRQPAGFVAYTSDSISFHRKSLGKHFLTTAIALLRAIAEKPERLIKLTRVLKVMSYRRSENFEANKRLGEVICIAVKPEFTNVGFIRKKKVKISEKLIEHALTKLKKKGVHQVRMIVDAENKAPLFLYHSMGAFFETRIIGGEKKILAIFDLRNDTSESNN